VYTLGEFLLTVCMSAIVLLVLFAGFKNLNVQGRCCQFFFVLTDLCFFTEMILVFLAAAGLPAPRRVATAPTRHIPTSLTPRHPRYNLYFRIMVIEHVTQLSVSRSKKIRCRYADLCISTNVSVSNCPRFLDSPRLRRWC
jgi:hypothetical protein